MPDGTCRRKRALICAVLIGLIGIPFCLLLIPERQAPMPPLPNPNGYDEIRAAVARMTPLRSFDPPIRGGSDDTLHAALRADVENNVEALRLARSGLNKECRVPVQDTLTYGTNHVAELARIKALTLTFIAEGQLAEREGRLAKMMGAFQSRTGTPIVRQEMCRMIPLSSAIPLTFRPSPVTSQRDRGRIGLFPLTSVLGERENCRLSFGISSDYEKT